jgi:hypothetical protein
MHRRKDWMFVTYIQITIHNYQLVVIEKHDYNIEFQRNILNNRLDNINTMQKLLKSCEHNRMQCIF